MGQQLEFFAEYTDTEILGMSFEELKKSHDKLRKALFARHGDLAKKYVDLHNRMDIIEHNICKGFALHG